MNDGLEIARFILADAERIEREKQGKALLPEEVRTIKSADFLKKIAPYLVSDRP